MKTYKLIEEGKLQERDQLTIKVENIDILSGELWKKGVGATVTVEEAIKYSLIDSDNTAYQILKAEVNKKTTDMEGEEAFVAEVYDYIDIPRELEGETAYITPKNYSSILRSLFFSAYL